MIAPRGTLRFILGLLACAGQPARAGEASQRPDATASSAKATAEPAPAWYLDDVRALYEAIQRLDTDLKTTFLGTLSLDPPNRAGADND